MAATGALKAEADAAPAEDGLSPEATKPETKAAPKKEMNLEERLKALVDRKQEEADKRVQKRSVIEQEWIRDLRQYNGDYEPDTLQQLKDENRSELFVNQTRPKTDACAARLFDMMFPTDERNFGILPTPVPTLAEMATEGIEKAKAMAPAANAALTQGDPAQAEAVAQQANSLAAAAEKAKADLAEARKRADAMEDEIDDQLTECQYAAEVRECIEEACKLGTAVMEGPVIHHAVRQVWRKAPQTDSDGQVDPSTSQSGWVLEMVPDKRPAYYRVPLEEFFPEMVRSPRESQDFYRRRLLNVSQMRDLSKRPQFNADAIREIIKEKPQGTTPTLITQLRQLAGKTNDPDLERYHVWEYRGALSGEDLRDLAEYFGKDKKAFEDIDPLVDVPAVLWFCQGKPLFFAIHPLDSGEPIYSVFTFAKDDSSMFGRGIPRLMRDPQDALGAGWRMMMDNAGLASGPQVEIDTDILEPADGNWELAPRKVWKRKAGASAKPGIVVHNIDSHQGELANVITLAKQFCDDETSMPLIAQGEQGAHPTNTAHGMSIIMNSVNVVFRRLVKNFDDQITTPNMRRLYHWNMQFNQRDEIKGDFQVDARGSSVLLVREIQSQNLLNIAQNWAGHPILGKFLLDHGLPAARKAVQSMMINADEILITDQQLKELVAQEAEAAKTAPPDPVVQRMQLQLELEDKQHQNRMQELAASHDNEMIKFAAASNIAWDKLQAMLQDKRDERASKERGLAAEIGMSMRQDRQAAITRQPMPSSGGAIA